MADPKPITDPVVDQSPDENVEPAEEVGTVHPDIKDKVEKWFNERYSKELESFAKKNRYLNEFNDAEELYQDMVEKVWIKAIRLFDPDRVTYVDVKDKNSPEYEKRLERAFNAIFTTTLHGYLASLATHRDTGKQQWEKKVKRLDQPIGSEDEDQQTSLLDTLESAAKDPDAMGDLRRMMKDLDRPVAQVLAYILKNYERGAGTQIWDDIRTKFTDPQTGKGWTKTRFLNALYNEPAFTDWAMEAGS